MTYKKLKNRLFFKKVVVLVVLITSICIMLCGMEISAQDSSAKSQQEYEQELYKDQFDKSGINELYDSLPEQAKEYFDESDIKGEGENKLNFNLFELMGNLLKDILDDLKQPLKLLFLLIGVILLTALINSIKGEGRDESYNNTYNIVSVLVVSGILVSPVIGLIVQAANTVKEVSSFILLFIPVFVGLLIATGKTLSGFAYNTFLFGAVQVISQISASMLVPMLGIYLALCITGSMSRYINIEAITNFVQKAVIWGMGILLTVFVSLLTLQGIVSSTADTVGIRAAKFALGSFVPIIGGALSEAFNSIQGCMSFIKSTVGVFGIVSCIVIFLPILLSIISYILTLNLVAMVADLLNIERVPVILRACSSTLVMMLAIVICFALLLIVSTTVMLVLGMGI